MYILTYGSNLEQRNVTIVFELLSHMILLINNSRIAKSTRMHTIIYYSILMLY